MRHRLTYTTLLIVLLAGAAWGEKKVCSKSAPVCTMVADTAPDFFPGEGPESGNQQRQQQAAAPPPPTRFDNTGSDGGSYLMSGYTAPVQGVGYNPRFTRWSNPALANPWYGTPYSQGNWLACRGRANGCGVAPRWPHMGLNPYNPGWRWGGYRYGGWQQSVLSIGGSFGSGRTRIGGFYTNAPIILPRGGWGGGWGPYF